MATNATGTHKLKPLIIGTAKSPRSFKGINVSSLPVMYRYNSNAWMRREIWESWLKYIDEGFRIQQRHVLLLVDNAPSHNTITSPSEDNVSLLSEEENEPVAESSTSGHRKQGRPSPRQVATIGNSPWEPHLTNIRVHYLPPNTTAHLQPLDAGIIRSFKAHYRQYYCRHVLDQFEHRIDIEKYVP